MMIKKGIPVSPGVAIAQAVVLDAVDQPIPRRVIPVSRVPAESRRLNDAIAASIRDIDAMRDAATKKLGGELAKIFAFHAGLLQDKSLIAEIEQMIGRERVTAEYAVYTVLADKARLLQSLGESPIRDRDSDIWDLARRLIGQLIGEVSTGLAQIKGEAILIAHDLTPSQTASLDKDKVKAIATDLGGQTSHTSIMAHALGIPAIVGVEGLTSAIATGTTVIIDGNRGHVIIDPDAGQLLEYRQYIQRIEAMEDELGEMSRLPAETTDGTEISLWANIEFPREIAAAVQKGAVGIGLYRTEFLFLASETPPTEEQQLAAYTEAIRACDGKTLTIRTLDLGADKIMRGDDTHDQERNPFLGCRSIRLCLQNLPLFKTQLRAILRASTEGPLRIMFPLISNIRELRQAKMMLGDVMEDLEDQGIPFSRNIPVGIMIEVPSAALQAATFARECDFFSIGTNDLIQYTVAVDRGNERIASLYSAAHPAVITLVKDVVRAAARAKIDVSLCGEMAGEAEFVMLLLGLGLRSLSLTPPAIPEVKRIIRAVSINQCQRLARRVSAMESDREVTIYLRDEIRKIMPEVFDGRSIES